MALVLAPGFMLDDNLWTDMGDALARFGPIHHVDPTRGHSIEEMAAQTLENVPGRFDLIGFSMGGYVARAIQRAAPERVRRMVLVATSARGDSAFQAQRKALVAKADPAMFGGISHRAIRMALAPDREGDTALVERIHAMSLRLGGEAFRRQSLFRRDGDLPQLAAITCPTLIVAGSQDRLRSVTESGEMLAAIPGARMTTIDAGHMIPMEAPEPLSSALTAFLDA
ncbi:alpha/beta hydrolase [uncultured Paracoccus sp.]|uniref:alpha/beta fold hydrolase n=1 Tax=uncultured Paracoccus sp. TaxID=189685 RepID=UPI00261BB1E7|nr:alpha/beta hydrolase [uncultured Paracoccus sp.]